MEPSPYRTDDPTYNRPTTPPRERTNVLEGFVPMRLVAGVLLVLVGVLVIVEPRILIWVVGLGLVGVGIWLLITGGYLGKPRQRPPANEPPTWRP